MRTIIVRLAEPEQTGGSLHGLVEVPGGKPEPFSGATALIDLIMAALHGPSTNPGDDHRASPTTRPEPDPDLGPAT